MYHSHRTEADAQHLLKLADLLRDTALTLTGEWDKERKTATNGSNGCSGKRAVPSFPMFEAERTIEAIGGALIGLVANPAHRIQQIMALSVQAKVLIFTAELKVPDILAAAGPKGLHIDELSAKTGVESRKLARIMRTLCSIHVYDEPQENNFTNNRISQALVDNEPLRALVLLANTHAFVTQYLGKYLLGPTGGSYEKNETAFQIAMDTNLSEFDWWAQKVTVDEVKRQCGPGVGYPGFFSRFREEELEKPDEQGLIARPEQINFGKAMIGSGLIASDAHVVDYPWGDLGDGGVVVDVGGGVGGFVLQLLEQYPKLRYVVQDRIEAVKQGEEEIFPKQAPGALENGQVSFMEHDFFKPNPVIGADVYWMRRVLHDWSDEPCLEILRGLKAAMRPNSRILIADCILNTTLGCPDVASAPAPLPANYGYWCQYNHTLGLIMMGENNGIERTYSEVMALVEKAGLKVSRVWPIRSLVGITEVVLPSSSD